MAWDDVAPSKDELASTSSSPAWDSVPPTKDELATHAPQGSWLDKKIPGGTPRGYIQGALNTLPAIGMVGGAAAAGTAGFALPVPGGAAAGAVVGAGLGDSAGESLKNLGEKYILGQDKTRSDIYGKPAMGFVEGAENEMGGQSLAGAGSMISATRPAKYVAEKAGSFGKWLANNASNVPKSDIEAYLKDPHKVMSIFKEAGGDEAEMADKIRSSINEKVQATKTNLNSQISKSLENRAGESIDSKSIVDKLEASKKGINPKLYPEQIQEVDQLIKKVGAVTENGKISLNDAHDLKQYLQKQAESTYEQSGQIFTRGEHSAKAAKSGAAEARELLNGAAPEIAGANSKLADLHEIEDVMNSNMLSKGKPSNSLYTAANGENATNAQALRRLDKAVGGGVMEDAKNLSAARTFGSPSLTPLDKTGKAAARMGATGILGAGLGYAAGGDEHSAIAGALAAEGLTSPMAIKLAMDSGIGLKALGKLGSEASPSIVGKFAEKAAPSSLVNKTLKAAGLDSPDEPQKGPQKWANDGFAKLLDHSEDQDKASVEASKEKLMATASGKKLLIAASSAKPGSKAMENILQKVKLEIGESK